MHRLDVQFISKPRLRALMVTKEIIYKWQFFKLFAIHCAPGCIISHLLCLCAKLKKEKRKMQQEEQPLKIRECVSSFLIRGDCSFDLGSSPAQILPALTPLLLISRSCLGWRQLECNADDSIKKRLEGVARSLTKSNEFLRDPGPRDNMCWAKCVF